MFYVIVDGYTSSLLCIIILSKCTEVAIEYISIHSTKA